MPCVPFQGGVVCLAPPDQRIRYKGRVYRFEIHRYSGPCLLNRKGDPVGGGILPERHPFWRAFKAWCRKNPDWRDRFLMKLGTEKPLGFAER